MSSPQALNGNMDFAICLTKKNNTINTPLSNGGRASAKRRMDMGKRKKAYQYIAAFLTVFALVVGSVPMLSAKAASAKGTLTNITAVYTGGTAVVGEEIKPENVYVTGYYVSGGKMNTSQIKEGFVVMPPAIQYEGENMMTVQYEGYTAAFSVTGKRVMYIEAEYINNEEVMVGMELARKNIKVTAFYTDGTSEEVDGYTLPVSKVYQKGTNTFSVLYGSYMATITVMGKEPLAVEELLAYYNGDEAVVGNEISKTDIEVTAFYNDGRTETVKNFTLSPSIPSKEGLNKMIVSYGGISVTIEVYAREKVVESITARYIGQGVVLGKMVDVNDIEVIATYDDGTTGRLSGFSTTGSIIEYEGDNIVVVSYDYFMEEIIVPGIKGFVVSYDNSMSQVLFGNYYQFTIATLGMNKNVPGNSFLISPLDASVIEQAVCRVIPTEEFIAFTITYDADDLIKEFPMGMKVTLPNGYDPDHFGVYYTPNQTTIMAKLDGEFLDEQRTEYQFIVHNPGTYVLIHEVSNLLVTEIEIEKDMFVRAGRNYSLTPVVVPTNAENKKISYWSSDESIATVSENGKVRTYKEGTCEIWIEAQDGSGVKAIVTLHVKQ